MVDSSRYLLIGWLLAVHGLLWWISVQRLNEESDSCVDYYIP